MPAARPSRLRLVVLLFASSALLAGAPGPIAVVDEGGEPVQLALQPEERALVVHFWATWCPECKTELPQLARAARACEGSGVRVVAVNAGESRDVIERFEASHEIGFPVLRDPRGAAWRRFARGLPANVVWTGAGQRSEVGPLDEAAWRRKLAALGCPAPEASR